jgi:hypothetical protein
MVLFHNLVIYQSFKYMVLFLITIINGAIGLLDYWTLKYQN